MGGIGSGRRPSLIPPVMVEDSLELPIGAVVGRGLLAPSVETDGRRTACTDAEGSQCPEVSILVERPAAGLLRLRLKYTVRREDRLHAVEEPVELDQTLLYSNGLRWWFRCPACSRRVGKLHLPPGQLYFACRRCHQLEYASRLSRCL